jgi:hypothetical protein
MIEWWQTFAKLQTFFDPALFHAPGKCVFVLWIVLELDFIEKDTFPLFDGQLTGILCRVGTLH